MGAGSQDMTALQSSTEPNQPSREQEPFQSLLERVQHAYDQDIGRLDDDLARRNQIIESQNQRIVNLEREVAKLNKVLTEFEEKLSVEDAEKRAMLASKNALIEKYNNLRKGAAALENFRKTIVNMVQVGSAPPIIQADLEASFAMEATDPSERNELIRDVPFPKRLKQPTRKTETALEESRERPNDRDPMWSNDEDGKRGRTQSSGDEGRTAQPNGPTNLRKTDTASDETIERAHDRDSIWSNDEDGLRGRTRSRGDEGRKHSGLEEFLRQSRDSREQMSETQQSLSIMTELSDERDRGDGARSRMGTTGHESMVDYTTLALSNADRTDFLDVINNTLTQSIEKYLYP